MTTNETQETVKEQTYTSEELLALKLNFKTRQGKPDVKKLQQLIYQEVINNSENITSIEMIGKAVKSYTNLRVLKLNEDKKNGAYQKIEEKIAELKENGEKVTKSILNRKYNCSYKNLNEYEQMNPEVFQ